MIIGSQGEISEEPIIVQGKKITRSVLHELSTRLSEAVYDIGRMYRADERTLSIFQELLLHTQSYNVFELSRVFLSERDVVRGYQTIYALLQEYLVDPLFLSESVLKTPDYQIQFLEESSEAMQQFNAELELLYSATTDYCSDEFHQETLATLMSHVRNHRLIKAIRLYRSAQDILQTYPDLYAHLKAHWGQGARLLQALEERQKKAV